MFKPVFTQKPLVSLIALICAVIISSFSIPAFAGQVIFHALKDLSPVSDGILRIQDDRHFLSSTGSAAIELAPGKHQAILQQYGQTLVEFSFELSEQEDNADISVILSADETPEIKVNRFSGVSEKAKQPGIVSGFVSSKESGESIAKAVISVVGSDLSTITADDGSYELTINRGQHQLRVAAPGFSVTQVNELGISADSFLELNIALAKEGSENLEEVLAIGSFIADTVTADKRDSSAILDVIGSEQLARFGDSSAASALKRVAGVSINDGKYAVVRGLNERYTAITLNGSTLPSPDPTRRVVPLDIFPSSILSQINVAKSNSADLPSDSTGGVIQLSSTEFSGEKNQKLSMSLGHTSHVTMSNLYTHEGGGKDFLGMDDGSRSLPSFAASSRQDFLDNILTDEEKQTIGRSFDNNYKVDSEKALPNMSLEYSFEDTRAIEDSENQWSYIGALKYKNEWEREDSERATYSTGGSGDLTKKEEFQQDRASNSVDLSAAFSAALNLNTAHTLSSNTMLLRQAQADTTYQSGMMGDNGRDVKKYFLSWEEKEFLMQQFLGEHRFYDEHDVTINWRTGISRATLDSPDNRSYSYESAEGEPHQLYASSIGREYIKLDDDNIDFGSSLEGLLIAKDNWQLRAEAGLDYFDRERNSSIERFGFTDVSSDIRTNQNIEQVLGSHNINPNEFVVLYQTLPSDSYVGEWQYNAFYGKVNYEYFDLYKAEVGARSESSLQTLHSANFDGFPTKTELDDSGILPSVNLTWFTAENFQTRFGFSQTKNRPDFREISNSIFYHPETRDKFTGNDDLQIAEIDNFDIRAEWYMSDRESVSLAIFSKDFVNPIEVTAKPASGSNVIFSFENQQSATVQGLEFDFKKEKEFGRGLAFLSGNLSFMESEVTLFEADISGNTERAMQGQPENIANLQLGFDDYKTAWEYTLVLNREGESLYAVGIQSLPDINEEARMQVDVNANKQVKENLNFKVSIDNLNDSPVEYTQGGEDVRTYKKGREFSASLSYTF